MPPANATSRRVVVAQIIPHSEETPMHPESNNDFMRHHCRIEENHQTMEVMVNALRRSAKICNFCQILLSHPGLFFLNVTNIHKVMHFLGNNVGMTREDIGMPPSTSSQ